MANLIDNPLEHLALSDIRWQTFERLLDEMGKQRCRIAYNDGDIEFMKVGLGHNCTARWLGNLIFFTAFETWTPLGSGGSGPL